MPQKGKSSPGSGRWPRGKSRYAADRNPKAADKAPLPIPDDTRIGAPQPKPNPNWGVIAKAWWKAIGMSDTARVYQDIDWMNAWIANDMLDQMDDSGYSAGLFKEWQHAVEQLHAPRLDLLAAQPDNPDADDANDDEARAATLELVQSLEDDEETA